MKFSVLAAIAISSSAGAVLGFQQHVFDSHFVDLDNKPGTLYDSQRLIQTGSQSPAQWMSLEDIQRLRQNNVGFMDITDAQELDSGSLLAGYTSKLPTELTQQELVKKASSQVSTKLYGDILKPFTAFHNRYYDSSNGQKSSQWLQQQVGQLTSGGHNVTVSAFKHRFPQSSVIARWEPQEDNGETVIISAHQDSVNQWLPWFGRAPGADDDGSGTVTILEALRVMVATSKQPPRRAVEFHWYAGEEGGLLGSQDVAKSYKKAGRKVVADLHFDMTGFWKKGQQEVIGLVQDNTDPETTELVKKLALAYTKLKTTGFSCGYGCSDHASWNKAGIRSAMAFESGEMEANTNIHSPRDTLDTLDFNHMVEFSKLAVGFAYEVGFI